MRVGLRGLAVCQKTQLDGCLRLLVRHPKNGDVSIRLNI